MSKINTYKVRLAALFFGLFMMLLLTGCANIDTSIELDGDKFSGSRVMTVSFDRDELAVRMPDWEEELDAQIQVEKPQQLDSGYNVTDNEVVYEFTLKFDSMEDYIGKVKNLLGGRVPKVTFKRSTGAFTRGLIYTEDFESRDLLSWLDSYLNEKFPREMLAYSSDSFWKQTGVKVKIDDNEYTCEGGKVDISNGGTSVVTSVAIQTQFKASGDIHRTMRITVPSTIDKKQLSAIDGYLNDYRPDDGTAERRTRSGSILYTVDFTAGSVAKLQTDMAKLLQSEDVSVTYAEHETDEKQPLAQFDKLIESLDFSCFGGEDTVNVSYAVSSELMPPYQIILNDDEGERNADAVNDGSQLVCSGNYSSVMFETVFRKMAKAEEVDYNLIQTGDNKFIRETVITFAADTDPAVLQNVYNHYNGLNAPYTQIKVETDPAPAVKIYVTGSRKKIVQGEAKLFGGVDARALGYDRDWGLFTYHPKTSLRDSYDISSLLDLVGVSRYIYTYSYEGNTITTVTCTVEGELISRDIKNEEEAIGFSPASPIQTITIQGYYFNGWAVFFTVVFALLGLALIVLAVLVYLYKTGRIDIPDRFKRHQPQPEPEPVPYYQPIPQPYYEPMPEPEPEPLPLPMPEPEPEPRDLMEPFADEPEEEPVDFDFMIPEPEPEPEPEPIPMPVPMPAEPDMNPVISYPERYIPTEAFAYVPYVPPAPEPAPAPEPMVRETPDDYTDQDMIDDFDALGLLGEYTRRVHKVKVKVRRVRVEIDDDEDEE